MRRLFRRRVPLRGAGVGAAGHAHGAAGPGLGGCPFDGVVAVAALVHEGAKLSARLVAPADILADHRDAGLDGAERVERSRWYERHALVVGDATDDYWHPCVRVGSVHVGSQHGAVTHWNRHVAL